jgi:hypothetical protein
MKNILILISFAFAMLAFTHNSSASNYDGNGKGCCKKCKKCCKDSCATCCKDGKCSNKEGKSCCNSDTEKGCSDKKSCGTGTTEGKKPCCK